ncbi:hypothetical protein AB0I55_11890 [Actinocatenispora sera]|uniref:hypothetical protein n=1 Tax=Actinocatenispora sera TaxID=390989 RepID=UPI0033E15444
MRRCAALVAGIVLAGTLTSCSPLPEVVIGVSRAGSRLVVSTYSCVELRPAVLLLYAGPRTLRYRGTLVSGRIERIPLGGTSEWGTVTPPALRPDIRYGFDLTDPDDALFGGSAYFTVAELPADDSGQVLVRRGQRDRVGRVVSTAEFVRLGRDCCRQPLIRVRAGQLRYVR